MSAEIDSLLELFVEELDDMLDGVDEHLSAIRLSGHPAGALAELRRIAHTIKSSAGMIGFSATQALAKSLETVIRRSVDAAQAPDAATADLIERGICALGEVARRARESGDEDSQRLGGLTGELEARLNT